LQFVRIVHILKEKKNHKKWFGERSDQRRRENAERNQRNDKRRWKQVKNANFLPFSISNQHIRSRRWKDDSSNDQDGAAEILLCNFCPVKPEPCILLSLAILIYLFLNERLTFLCSHAIYSCLIKIKLSWFKNCIYWLHLFKLSDKIYAL
jgi:hypothetical protein